MKGSSLATLEPETVSCTTGTECEQTLEAPRAVNAVTRDVKESRVHRLRMLSTMVWFSDGLRVCLQSPLSHCGHFLFLASNVSQAAGEKRCS